MTLAVGRNITLEDALADAEARYVAAQPEEPRAPPEAARAACPAATRAASCTMRPSRTIARGEGARLFDLDGHDYLDFLGEYSAGLYGHSDPVIRRGRRTALEGGIVLGGPNRYEAELAAAMCAPLPLARAGAVLQLRHRGQPERDLRARAPPPAAADVMVFEGAYHGGVLSFAQRRPPMNVPFPYVIGALQRPRADAGADRARTRTSSRPSMIEPMMGGGGCIPAEPEFLPALRAAASRHGIVLIFDEVMTSRLAPGGLQARLGIVPDMTTFGKYLGGGMSFGAFGGRGRDHAPLRPEPAGRLRARRHLQQQRADHGRRRRRPVEGVHARGGATR